MAISWCRTRPKFGRVWGGVLCRHLCHTHGKTVRDPTKDVGRFSDMFSTLCWWKSTESQVETYDSHSFLLFSLVGMILMEWLVGERCSFLCDFLPKDRKRLEKDDLKSVYSVQFVHKGSMTIYHISIMLFQEIGSCIHFFLHYLSLPFCWRVFFLKKTFVPWDLLCWVAFFFWRAQVVGLNLTATAIGAMAVQLLQVDGESVGGSGFDRWCVLKKGPLVV